MVSYIVTVWLDIIPLSDVVLPPFTSKVTKTAFYSLVGRKIIFPKRRVFFSVLYRDDRPLYRVVERGDNLRRVSISAREGDVLSSRVSFVTEEDYLGFMYHEIHFRFGGGRFIGVVKEVEFKKFSSVSMDVGDRFTLKFMTPVLLSVPGRSKFLRKRNIKRRYKLLPDLSLMLMLLVYDFKMQGLEVLRCTPLRMFRWAYRAIAELNYYGVRPVNVLYSFEGEKAEIDRGFVGSVTYEILDDEEECLEDLRILLGYMSRMGVGKSRNIGFGDVRIISHSED